MPVGEETEVADAHKPPGQHMQEESAQELFHGQRHHPFLVLVRGIAPPESNAAIVERNEPVIGDRNAMGIAAEIA